MARYANLYKYNYKGQRVMLSAKSFPPSFFLAFHHTLYKVKEHDTLDKLAYEFYDGKSEYDWIIKAANGFELPTDMNPGDIIVIPLDYRSIIQSITSQNGM